MNEIDLPGGADRVQVGIRPDGVYRYVDVLDVSGDMIETHEFYIGSGGDSDA